MTRLIQWHPKHLATKAPWDLHGPDEKMSAPFLFQRKPSLSRQHSPCPLVNPNRYKAYKVTGMLVLWKDSSRLQK